MAAVLGGKRGRGRLIPLIPVACVGCEAVGVAVGCEAVGVTVGCMAVGVAIVVKAVGVAIGVKAVGVAIVAKAVGVVATPPTMAVGTGGSKTIHRADTR
jgi:hypothetical protein